MKINLLAKNMELTQAVNDYVMDRMMALDTLLAKMDTHEEVFANFEVSKSTNHHKAGDVFHSDCIIKVNGREFYASSDKEDLYQAIDEVKERLLADISKDKSKKITMFHRGARKLKNLMKSARNWRK
jgi:ribosomal subunit interface protein